MEIFERCQQINYLIEGNQESKARNELILLLDHCKENQIPYDTLINHLIRKTGLYQYIITESAAWQEKLIYEAFKVDIGDTEAVTLHKEQNAILKKLVNGESLAVSAPTSFGKSFIIDAFIALRKPHNIVIIVPTIALTDETRRRLYKKFAGEYQIITTSDVKLKDKNIFIFPQERAIHYANVINKIDLLVIDEFYKASVIFDKERASSLQNAIMKLGEISAQKYYLAPNITTIKSNPFTEGMEVVDKLDFNTVILNIHQLYKQIGNDEIKKADKLLEISKNGKSLIYVGLFTEIDKVTALFLKDKEDLPNKNLNNFSEWLNRNYSPNWPLPELIKKGVGIHNGRLHRSLTQIQIRLFEERAGIMSMISTSSIIEGVNTSAQNVVLWSNKSGAGNANIKNFTYKNIKGRGGRMFKHFVGQIYELVEPPEEKPVQLNLDIPDSLLGNVRNPKFKDGLSQEQLAKKQELEDSIDNILGKGRYAQLLKEDAFQTNDVKLLIKIATSFKGDASRWNGLGFLNSPDPNNWDRHLSNIAFLDPSILRWSNNSEDQNQYKAATTFIKILANNWRKSLPNILKELEPLNITINDFFNLEKKVSYGLAALINDVNVIQKELLLPDKRTELSPFISKVSSAFLPPVVFQLEEYGLPRMISKKIHHVKLMNFEDQSLTLNTAVEQLKRIGRRNVIKAIEEYLVPFDEYIINFFYSGITTVNESKAGDN